MFPRLQMIKSDLNGNSGRLDQAGSRNKKQVTEWLKNLARRLCENRCKKPKRAYLIMEMCLELCEVQRLKQDSLTRGVHEKSHRTLARTFIFVNMPFEMCA